IFDSVEMHMLFCALALGIVQLLAAVLASVLGRGMGWAAGPRDEGWPTIGRFSARLERAYRNFLETFPFFAVAVLVAHAANVSTTTSVLGAQIYLGARLIYIPVYVFGIPYLRTLVWVASLAGIVMVMAAIWPGI
ncbi:MAG: inner rane protein, partial [Gammaproteobacteria bacterium]|nr:inner rane protein [Gammaproteobacteria bacterium]